MFTKPSPWLGGVQELGSLLLIFCSFKSEQTRWDPVPDINHKVLEIRTAFFLPPCSNLGDSLVTTRALASDLEGSLLLKSSALSFVFLESDLESHS